MSKKLLFKGGHATGMIPFEIEDFSTLYMRDARVDEKTKAYIDSVIGNSVLNLCPYRNVLVTHKYDTVEGNVVTLNDCQDDEVIQLSEIQGNTMVNCNKDTDKELILNGNIETSGYGTVTTTEGVDGGLVDVSLEGNTMVNVCDQEEPVAITKSYEVTTGNHVALQGEYDGKCRPNVYGNTLVNLALAKDDYSSKNGTAINSNINLAYNLKAGVTYTLIRTISEFSGGAIQEAINFYDMSFYADGTQAQDHNCRYRRNGQYVSKFTPTKDVARIEIIIGMDNIDKDNGIYPTITISDYMILEGDYTNKPIPDYFTGMKSSFEDKLITDEKDKNYGKYKVDYKVTGKNKCHIKDGNYTNVSSGLTWTMKNNQIQIDGTSTGVSSLGATMCYPNFINGKTYVTSTSNNNVTFYISYNDNGTRKYSGGGSKTYTHNSNYTDIMCYLQVNNSNITFNNEIINCQIEEGTTATDYEPYKEYTKTLYLNSPLLEGDTIEQSGNNIIHNHRYAKVVLDGSDDEKWGLNKELTEYNTTQFVWSTPLHCININGRATVLTDKIPSVTGDVNEDNIWVYDGNTLVIHKNLNTVDDLKKWLQQNPITVVYELATPTQEIISSNDNLLLDSYTNGHLDVDTVVPIDKVKFNGWGIMLKYLYPNQDYTIQFESDNLGKLSYIGMNYKAYYQDEVTKGVNKFIVTTTNEIQSNFFELNGIGFNASKIVVTPKVDEDFGYFKGMKSVGECEDNKIEILSQNKNLLKNTSLSTKNEWVTFNGSIVEGVHNNKAIYATYVSTPQNYYDILQQQLYSKLDGIKKISGNKWYTLSFYAKGNGFVITHIYPSAIDSSIKGFIDGVECGLMGDGYNNWDLTDEWVRHTYTFKTNSDMNPYANLLFRLMPPSNGVENVAYISCPMIEEGKVATEFFNDNSNKKEILMNEPLRGLPNGVKDKYVIIDGKWYIERNCMAVQFKDLKYDRTDSYQKAEFPDVIGFRLMNTGINAPILCDRFAYTNDRIINFGKLLTNKENINITSGGSFNEFFITIQKAKLQTLDFKGLMKYFTDNPMEIITKATTITYEPIDYNPFEVYTDTTHISNNSTIPCNMIIRNSGFNCILKPNTTYTVSSNNGLSTVTTKDSIGDSVLRFYDKDTTSINKMNKVLVLEGDYVTGNPPIPAFFEGMESAFEQELVTDEKDEHYGKYKVNVKAVGKNLVNVDNIIIGYIGGDTENEVSIMPQADAISYIIPCLPNTTYVCYTTGDRTVLGSFSQYPINGMKCNVIGYVKITTGVNDRWLMAYVNSSAKINNLKVQIEQGDKATEYEPYKENNITFYINEPLRGVGDVKDKVYVKEDKVVVERNCSSVTLDGTETTWQAPSNDNYKYGVFTLHMPHLNHKEVKVDDRNEQGALCNTLRPYWWWTNNDSFETVPDNSIHYLEWDDYDTFYIIKKNLKTVDELKQWLKSNKTEYIYPLATPVYEEVECDLSKLALEGYNHGTLFYNSNIPVTTQFYDFNVNIKDMLIPNETYYITFIADRVKDITINLSGVQVNYKTSMGYNKVPIQLGDVVNTNFSMDSRGVELSDIMVSTSTSLIYVKDMNDVCVYDEANNKYSITITSTNENESDKRVILLDYPLLRLNKDIYDRLYYSNKDSRYRIDKKVFKHKFTNDYEYNKYAAETNDTYYSSFISLNETIKDYVVVTNEKVKTVKVEDDKYYFKIKWSDLGVSDKTEVNGNQGVKDFFNDNEVYLYYATDGFVEIIDGLRRQTLKVYQPETFMKFSGNTTTTITILIPMKNV